MKTFLKKYLPAPIFKLGKFVWKIFHKDEPGVSYGHKHIKDPDREKLKEIFSNAWKDKKIPPQQLKLTLREMPHYNDIPAVSAFINLVKETKINNPSILEIGCSTGYYSEFLEKAGINTCYEGCDYSEAFIDVARERHPHIKFKVEDSTKLGYKDNSFDIAVSGCCILHIIDYEKAIAETARVAKDFALFSRTPVIHSEKTSFFEKIGYGVPMVEIVFNEEELVQLFHKYGLSVVAINTNHQYELPDIKEPCFIKSYLCQKISSYDQN